MDLIKGRAFRQWASLIIGAIISALPFPLFFVGNSIAPGGVTGLATVLNGIIPVPIGTMALVLNLPLFLIGWRRMGRAFAVKSLIAMVILSAAIDLLPLDVATDDPLLAAIFGGALLGFGIALVIRGGGTTGGTDMAAAMIHQRFPVVTVGGVLLSLDCVIILLSAIVFDLSAALVSMIALFMATQVMDRVIEGFGSAKAFFVFSARTDAIAAAVMERLQRGATFLHARGAFSGQEKDVLLCVVTRLQIPQFKAIVTQIDPEAFMMVTDVREALGEGFTQPQKQGERPR